MRDFPPPRKSSLRNVPLQGGLVVKGLPNVQLEGGWFEDQSFAETVDNFNPHETKTTEYRFKEPPAFYSDRLDEYWQNEWYGWLVDQLNVALFSGYDFEGPGAEDVKKFFEKTCPDAKDQVRLMGLNVVREGTGAFRKFKDESGKLVQIYAINGRLIKLKEGPVETASRSNRNAPAYEVKFDSDLNPIGVSDASGEHSDTNTEVSPDPARKYITRMTIDGVPPEEWKADFVEWPRTSPEDYRNGEVALCRIRRDRWTPYGLPYGNSCFHIIKSMRSLNRDLIAALKRLSATLLVFKGDVEYLGTEAEKRAAILAAVKAFDDMDAATTGVVGIDGRNSLGYPEGTRTDRLIPIMGQLEPVMSALLLNFLVPLGIVEQTGANKSLIAKQDIRARKQLREDQAAVARFFETQIFSDITDKECHMVFDTELDPEYWVQFWSTGAVSRERVQKEFSIIDTGKTFAPDLGVSPMGGGSSKSRDSNDDDASTPGRKGGQGDTGVEKGGR